MKITKLISSYGEQIKKWYLQRFFRSIWIFAKDSIQDENDKKMNVEVIEQLFLMMENCTQQMVEMKEMNNLK